MARSKPNPIVVQAEAEKSGVRVLRLEGARPLYTVGPASPIWVGKEPEGNFDAAIVRLQPPVDATDERVELTRAFFLRQKAVKVIVLPRPRAEVIPAAAQKGDKAKAFGAREAVLSLVEESNSKDKDNLRTLCEKVMGVVGL
jgi:hypothetical protein